MEATLHEMLHEIRLVGNPERRENLERIWNGLHEEYMEMANALPDVEEEGEEVDDSTDRLVWDDSEWDTDDDDNDDDE
jgi:hypothetical protein